jgi:hypothetical protein
MDHRFQVFISSTYSDLIEERSKVYGAVVEADCFAAGMEAFPASGDEQFEHIKKVIDQSDYYVLIIGGRYGSRSGDGVSYTEMEFNYAISKGIPILVFAHRDIESLPLERRENDEDSIRRLSEFRGRALNGRLGKMWGDADGLANQVMRSLLKISHESPGIGWLRSSNEHVENIVKERDEVTRLLNVAQLEVNRLSEIISEPAENLSGGEDRVELEFSYKYRDNRGQSHTDNASASTTWNKILCSIGPDLIDWHHETNVSRSVARFLASLVYKEDASRLSEESMRTLTIQFIALDLIERKLLNTVDKSAAHFWCLTERGRHQLFQLRPIRKSS